MNIVVLSHGKTLSCACSAAVTITALRLPVWGRALKQSVALMVLEVRRKNLAHTLANDDTHTRVTTTRH